MIATVRRWVKTETTPDEDRKRLDDLNKLLGFEYEKVGFLGNYLFVIRAYEDKKQSGQYPYPGGRGQQPQWILDDFDTCAMIEEREMLLKKLNITSPSNAPPLPKFRLPGQRKEG